MNWTKSIGRFPPLDGGTLPSDVDIAIQATEGNWTAVAGKWEQHLTEAIGVTVNIRTLANDTVRGYCAELSVPLKG